MANTITQSQVFTGAGTYTFTASQNETCLFLTMIGGGGGGGGTNNGVNDKSSAGGGGAGEFCRRHICTIAAGGTATVTIGAGGTGGIGSGNGSNGGVTSFAISGGLTFSCQGGFGGQHSAAPNLGGPGVAGAGGGINAGSSGQSVNLAGVAGTAESITYYGGSGGASNCSCPGGIDSLEKAGGPCEAWTGGVAGHCRLNFAGNAASGGGGGGSSPWGVGGTGGDGAINNGQGAGGAASSTSYGAGGGGAGSTDIASGIANARGGSGADGYCLVEWMCPP